MSLHNDAYDTALELFEKAVAAFCRGDVETGESLLASLDCEAIEKDRAQLLGFARTAREANQPPSVTRADKTVPREIKEAVQRRDRFHCRFTGRRLIDTRVFRELARISTVFHFDEHHSVNPTKRGPGGHPLVRTHGAAYEHAQPISRGGLTTIDNVFHTSVQLNESKGARILDRVDVPEDRWNGLLEYLEGLGKQRSAVSKALPERRAAAPPDTVRRAPISQSASAPRRMLARIREAAATVGASVFALEDNSEDEEAFVLLRRTHVNSYFITERNAETWMIHRLYCSSLAFSVPRKLTASPKVCADKRDTLVEWAKQLGVEVVTCSRCRRPVQR
jgi:hypothetical protein